MAEPQSDTDLLQRAASTFYGRGRVAATLRLTVLFGLTVSPLVIRPDSDLAPVWSTVAGVWVLTEFFVLRRVERSFVRDGALAQEMSDRARFAWAWPRSYPPPLSDLVVGAAASRTKPFAEPWYSSKPTDAEAVRLAILENATYTTAQLKLFRYCCIVGLLMVVVTQLLIVRDWTVREYLVRLALPTIPAAISLLSLLDLHAQALEEWSSIEFRARSEIDEVALEEMQGDVFRARSRFPLMPKWIYRIVKRSLRGTKI